MKDIDLDALLKKAYKAAMGDDYEPPKKPPLESLIEWVEGRKKEEKVLEENM